MQTECCENNGVAWALMIFFLHFLGEVFPLAVLFWMQIVLSRLKIQLAQHQYGDTLNDESDVDRLTIPRS